MRLAAASLLRHTVFRNTAVLFIVQLLNYAIPLVLIPYLAGVLGADLYGIYAFGMSIFLLGMLVIDYGFPRHVLYEVATHRADGEYVNRLLGGVLIIRLAILGLIAFALAVFVAASPGYAGHRVFLMLTVFPLLGMTLQLPWVFQGVERSEFVLLYSLIGRVAYFGLLLWLVKVPEDYHWIPITHGLGQLASACLCLWLFRFAGFGLSMPSFDSIKKLLSAAVGYFWARLASANFGYSGVFVLGMFVAPAQLAAYAASEQLYRAILSICFPLSEALIPYMRRVADMRMFRRVLVTATTTALFGTALSYYFAAEIIDLLFGDEFADAVTILRIFLLVVPVTITSIFLGHPLLGALGYPDAVNRIVIRVAIVFVIGIVIMAAVGIASPFHMAMAIAFSELVILARLVRLGLRVRRSRPGFASVRK